MVKVLLFLILSVQMFGQSAYLINRRTASRPPPAAGGASYIISENFEGTGIPTGWGTGTGTPDYDYTTSPMEGAQGLRLDASSADQSSVSPTNTAAAEVWIYYRLRVDVLPASSREAVRLRNAGTSIARVFITTSGQMQFRHGTVSVSTVGVMAPATDYHCWLHYLAGSGANGVADWGFSTDGTEPTSGNNFGSTASGDATGSIDNFQFFADFASATGPIQVFDKFRYDDADIGSNPD